VTLPRPPVLLITDRAQATLSLENVVADALAVGCRWVLVREKDLEPRARLKLVRRVVDLARPYGASVLVSADVPAVKRAGADGVHLPAGSDMAAARAALGVDAVIGVSTHNASEAEAAVRDGADYITVSPIFESESKPGYGPALGLGALRTYAARLPLPVIALGGVTERNAKSCLATGAAGVAVMGEVMRAACPGAAMYAVLSSLAGASSSPG